MRAILKIITAVLFCGLSTLLFTSAAAAQGIRIHHDATNRHTLPIAERYVAPNRIVVLDLSGSMRGLAAAGDDERLYQLGRELAYRLLRSAPEGGLYGLITFGDSVDNPMRQNREQSCHDIRRVIPFERYPRNNPQLRNILQLEPKPYAETPLLRSLRAAMEMMKNRGKGGSIILITDLDRETCDRRSLCEQLNVLTPEMTSHDIHLTHVVAARQAGAETSRGAVELANCQGSNRIDLQGGADIDKIASRINDDLEEMSRLAQVHVAINFARRPFMYPAMEFFGPLNAKPLTSYPPVRQPLQWPGGRMSFPKRIDLLLKPDYYTFWLASGSQSGLPLTRKIESKVLRSRANQIDLQIPVDELRFILHDSEGRRLSNGQRLKWTIEDVISGKKVNSIAEGPFKVLLARGMRVRVTAHHQRTGRMAASNEIIVGTAPRTIYLTLQSDINIPRSSANVRLSLKLIFSKGADVSLVSKEHELPAILQTGRAYPVALKTGGARMNLGVIHPKTGEIFSYKGIAPPLLIWLRVKPGGEPVNWTIRKKKNGKDLKFTGPEFIQLVPPGTYDIQVSNTHGKKAKKTCELNDFTTMCVGNITLH